MPRIYTTKGDDKRGDPITALFTREEKRRVCEAAQAANLKASVFIHQLVLSRLQDQP